MGGSVILMHSALSSVREGARVRFVVERLIRLVGGILRAREEMRKGRNGEATRAAERRMAIERWSVLMCYDRGDVERRDLLKDLDSQWICRSRNKA